MAGERGIQLTESRTSESGSFTTLILASLTTDSGTRTAAATVFGNQFLRLVRLDGFQLDAFLDGKPAGRYRFRDNAARSLKVDLATVVEY